MLISVAIIVFAILVVFVPLLWFRWQGIREETDRD